MAGKEGRTAQDSMKLRGRRLFRQERDMIREISQMKGSTTRKVGDFIMHVNDQQQSALLVAIYFVSQKEIKITPDTVPKLTLRAKEAMHDFSFQSLEDLLEGPRRARVNFLKPFYTAMPWLVSKLVKPREESAPVH